MRFPFPNLCFSIPIGFAVAFSAMASEQEFSPAEVAFFREEVRPILEANCFKCHGGEDAGGKPKIRSGLQLISRRGILQGGSLGPAVDPADSEQSLLLQMISYKDDEHEMPPSGQLPEEERKTLTRWVEMGLPWTPEDADLLVEVEDEAERSITEINEHTRAYWSYRPMKRPEVPQVGDPAWSQNPIDAFVLDRLKEKGLMPNGVAAPRVLVRRAYHNVIGLPPAPDEVDRLAEDFSEEKWRSLIDELLESPHYGEKWARHWLDVVRYAESNGFERDSAKEHIWRYRDYVIRALNEDKPYDRFILEQLAGDELDEVTPDSLIATGYHRLMQWDDEPADRKQHVYDVLDDNVRVTSEGFLGMTLGCARCHDHKGDPVSQEDYYRFMAFFHGVTPMDQRRVIENIDLAMPREEMEKRQREWDERRARLARTIREMEAKAKRKLRVLLPDETLEGTASASPTLIPLSQERPQNWTYTTTRPAEDWFTVGFRPRDWKQGLAPFGRHRLAKTPWRSPEIWMQKTFGLTSLPSALTLTIRHDEDVDVYLNGQLVFQATGHITENREVLLDKEALSAAQTGRNVVAVHVSQTVGGQFIDLGLEADFGGHALAQLIERHHDEVFTPDEGRRYRRMREELDRLHEEESRGGVQAMIVQEHGPEAEPMFVHLRGSVHNPGKQVAPGFPEILGGGTPSIPESEEGAQSSGQRRVLAEWIASPDNPRTARVAVNRLWQHHFGRGLCPTPSDFGFLGELASHPDLLDWLACELVDRRWSLKAMHRLIMTSRTYRLSSRAQEEGLSRDPENQWLWRFNMRRLSAEELRDGMLKVAGQLNRRVGGPSFYPTLPPEVLATSSTGAGKWGRSTPEEEARRSVYITVKRSLKPPELTDFDFADTDAPCAARFVTTVPNQALFFLNSKVVNDRAAELAQRLRREAGDDVEAQVKLGLRLISVREPQETEVKRCLAMIDAFVEKHQLSPEAALDRFCLLALNLNEFLYID